MVETREDHGKRERKEAKGEAVTAAKCLILHPSPSLLHPWLLGYTFVSLLPPILPFTARPFARYHPHVKPNHFYRVTDISYYVYIRFSGINRFLSTAGSNMGGVCPPNYGMKSILRGRFADFVKLAVLGFPRRGESRNTYSVGSFWSKM